MSKSCVICGGDESEDELLLEAPCGRHWVCPDDVASYFERATTNESLFPPKCCGQMFLLHEYEDYIPFETAWAYQVKEQGEYAILAKFRIYCANRPCARFLHPTSHVEDPNTKITYAICESDDCGKVTCVKCKTLLDHGTKNHTCQQTEDDAKFKLTATKKGYQECFVCGATVELAEACNHITCECGHDFCYICGKDWDGLHGCPHYGPATYDDEGYNQDGFHRTTGLNRDGLTRRQDLARARGEEDPNEDDDAEQDEDPDWDVLQHLTPEQLMTINVLQGADREDALDQHRIELMETQGVTFNQGQPEPNAIQDDEHNEAQGEDDEVQGEMADDDQHGEEQRNDPQDNSDHFIHQEALQNNLVANVHTESDVLSANNENFRQLAIIDDGPDPELSIGLDWRSANTLHQPDSERNRESLEVGEPYHLNYSGASDIQSFVYAEARPSSSSESDEIRPATPMDIDEPAENMKGLDRPEHQTQVQAPLSALYDNEHI
ncbi:hypothetical protein BKA66DRAFT_444801 [Pyrenochaeta sp. MPI-SDFR-AT-0127]|nr:hypothetical protein BKA66DRAFT_444801 [Pyrenochaeta sp. MPI-SDFR-AT-0127]